MKKLLKAILGFGAIGFVMGLLFAPEKGDDTRKKLKDKIDEVKKSMKCCDKEGCCKKDE